jgi:DNA-binding XRE family transcriptional regulator
MRTGVYDTQRQSSRLQGFSPPCQFQNKNPFKRKDFVAKLFNRAHNPHDCEDIKMKIPIENSSAIGKVVRASRKAQGIRQDDAAGSIGVSENFLGKIERGSDSVQWGKLFQVMQGLGIRVILEIPESVANQITAESSKRAEP